MISTIKNCCFLVTDHSRVLFAPVSQGGINLLSSILTPLLGPEEYDLAVVETFPEELQFLEETKEREGDATLRQMLVECLLLITASREGRDMLRDKGVYEILQKMHLQESNEGIRDVIERVVDLLKRDEPAISEIEE